jgi:hypothetical protein
MVADQAILCEWSSKLQKIIPNFNFKDFDKIETSWFEPPAQKTNEWKSFITTYVDDAKYYDEFRNSALELKSRSDLNDLELTMFAFAPYFLGLALAMQLAKVRYK